MTQTELIAPSSVETGDPGYWEPNRGGLGHPIDVWSRFPTPQSIAPPVTLPETFDRQMELVLIAWRTAERQLEGLVEASPMRTMVQSEIGRLRTQYQSLFARKR